MLKYTSQGHKLSLVANDPIVEQASRLFLDGRDAHPTRWRIKFLEVPLYEGALGWHLWEKFFVVKWRVVKWKVENGELY
jgi:hypothetical protein